MAGGTVLLVVLVLAAVTRVLPGAATTQAVQRPPVPAWTQPPPASARPAGWAALAGSPACPEAGVLAGGRRPAHRLGPNVPAERMLEGDRIGPWTSAGPAARLRPDTSGRVPLGPVAEEPILARHGTSVRLVRDFDLFPVRSIATVWVQELASAEQAAAAERALVEAACPFALEAFPDRQPGRAPLGAVGLRLVTADGRVVLDQLSVTAGTRRVLVQAAAARPRTPDRAALTALLRCVLDLAAARALPSRDATLDPCAKLP